MSVPAFSIFRSHSYYELGRKADLSHLETGSFLLLLCLIHFSLQRRKGRVHGLLQVKGRRLRLGVEARTALAFAKRYNRWSS